MNETQTGCDAPVIRLVAVGDLLLPAAGATEWSKEDAATRLRGVRDLLAECDIACANLECTLPGDGETVPTEPRVVASPELIRGTLSCGIGVVSLANNHTFDCFETGFERTRRLLDDLKVVQFGAGDDLAQATAPAVVEVRGVRLGFLGAADRQSGPNRFAGPADCGVAPLDAAAMMEAIGRLGGQVDHVIVSVHWGEERFRIPSPKQVEQARAFAEAGASLVIGHHPHVVQGMEVWRDVPIVYSLGNFVANEVPFTNGDRVTWNRTERTGCVLCVDLAANGIVRFEQIPTYDDGKMVQVDTSGFGQRRLARVNRALARGVTPGRYRRERFRVKTVTPALAHLKWSELKRLRPGKVWKFIKGIGRTSWVE